jgi:hypothetical protein
MTHGRTDRSKTLYPHNFIAWGIMTSIINSPLLLPAHHYHPLSHHHHFHYHHHRHQNPHLLMNWNHQLHQAVKLDVSSATKKFSITVSMILTSSKLFLHNNVNYTCKSFHSLYLTEAITVGLTNILSIYNN